MTAYDIVLILPTIQGIQLLLNACDKYTSDFWCCFNAKCLVNRHIFVYSSINVEEQCFIGDNVIEVVYS